MADTGENPIITEPFYVRKFMEIQQQNIVMSVQLKKIDNDEEIKKLIIEKYGNDFFEILQIAPA